MTDKKTEERTIKDVLCDDIDRRLEENPPKMPSLEEFKAMAYERLAEADAHTETDAHAEEDTKADTKVKSVSIRTRRLRTAGLVAGFIAAVIIGAFAFNAYIDDVGADKNPKEEIVTEDGVIIEDGGWGSSEEEDNVWTIEEWENIGDGKKAYPELLIPTYIPDGYTFKQLTIIELETGATTCEYLFYDSDETCLEIEISILNNRVESLDVGNVTDVIVSSKGEIYIKNNKIATIRMNDGIIINIWYDFPNEEIVRVIDNLSG